MLDPVDRELGRRLRWLRLQKRRSQGEVAAWLGISFQLVHRYERGDVRMSAAAIWQLADFFDVDVDFFFNGMREAASGYVSRLAEPRRPRRPRQAAEVAEPSVPETLPI
jgi:transcriptional regulator with XRE-family HTH domain